MNNNPIYNSSHHAYNAKSSTKGANIKSSADKSKMQSNAKSSGKFANILSQQMRNR